jgi:sialidase-1
MSRLTRTPIVAAACVLACVATTAVAGPAGAAAPAHSEHLLFDGGYAESLNGVAYHSFRIPSLVRTKANTLLAFAEGRAASNDDHGNINLLYKRSTNNGATWSSLREVVGAGQGTWGNPTAVADQTTGTIWLFMSWNPAGYSINGVDGTTRITAWEHRKVYLSKSTDDGLTWTDPVDMSATLKPRTQGNGAVWAWDAIGPGVGIQMPNGRLVIPAQHRNLYSDDHGVTWKLQRITTASGAYQENTSEGTVLALTDGRLMRNDRAETTTWETGKRRWVARGTIDGSYTTFAPHNTLLDPACQGSILRYNLDAPTRIVFLNSASTETRTKMNVRISYDEGQTWPIHRFLSDAPLPDWAALGSGNWAEGGYSSMAKTADYFVGALVEVNENTSNNANSYRGIVFRKFNLPWMLNGTPE